MHIILKNILVTYILITACCSVAKPIIPILGFISIIRFFSSLSLSSIFTDFSLKGGIFFILLLLILYLCNTSLKSFLVLYEENDLSFFFTLLGKIHKTWKSKPILQSFPSVVLRNARPVSFSFSKILITVSLNPNSYFCKNEMNSAVLYFLILFTSESQNHLISGSNCKEAKTKETL